MKKISKLNILSIIDIITFIIMLYLLLNINILPTKYLILIIVIISIINILSIIFINIKKKIFKIIGIILIIIAIIINIIGTYYLYYANNFLDKSFSNNEKTVTTYYIVTNKSNNYTKKDIKGDIYYYDNNSINKALTKIKKEFDVNPKTYDDAPKMIGDIVNNEIDFILIDKNSYNILLTLDNTINSNNFKIIYELDITSTNETSEKTKDAFNIYIGGKDFAGLIDYNAIITVNTKTHEILMTSIPRDYYMEIAGTNGKKDSLSHMYAFGEDANELSLEKFFDINIDYNIKVTTESLVELVDTIGGITYCSDQAYTTTHALILNSYDDSGKEKLYVKKGCQHLNGIETLTVARERNAFVGRDRVRQKNCQKIILAIFDKLKSTDSFTNYKEILDSLSNLYTTTIPKDVVTSIAKDTIDGVEWKFTTQSVDGTDSNDVFIAILNDYDFAMIPDMNSVNQAKTKINEVLNNK